MKNLSTVLSALAFIGVVILFGMHFSGKYGNPKAASLVASGSTVPAKIAYVNIDTLEAHYEYLKNKKEEFAKRQETMQAELQGAAEKMQNDYAELQRKAQAGSLSQSEGQAAQKRLEQMQQSLETRRQALTEQLVKEQDVFNKDLQKRIDSFLTDYNKTKNYDYILSYTSSGSIMFANKQLDISQDVIKGMNELAKKMDDPTKKK
ncbi:MAG: OmpH family outer membrane protein [Bacteroidota bacterium]